MVDSSKRKVQGFSWTSLVNSSLKYLAIPYRIMYITFVEDTSCFAISESGNISGYKWLSETHDWNEKFLSTTFNACKISAFHFCSSEVKKIPPSTVSKVNDPYLFTTNCSWFLLFPKLLKCLGLFSWVLIAPRPLVTFRLSP